MKALLLILVGLSGISFFYYGVHCIFSFKMKAEFDRYGLQPFRSLVGALEVLGGLGVFCGAVWKPILAPSAFGLALLMILGLGVRVKVRDSLAQMFPAAFLLLVNVLIVFLADLAG
jgi:uncharacterized membrane protein YphA (DoxX/SURF4 family)